MSTSHEYRIPTPSEQDAYAEIISKAFPASVAESRAWLDTVGRGTSRVLIEGGKVVAGLLFYEMGQWFGGKRVPTAGIAGVAVDPLERGRGAATRLMRTAVASLAGEGFALAALYPATQPVYRRAGFEQAGSRFEIRVPMPLLDFRDRSLSLRLEGPDDRETINALHRHHGRLHPGSLDRSDYLWQRLRKPRLGSPPTCYLVEGEGGAEGYCFLANPAKKDGDRQELVISDLVVTSRRAAARLLAFFADYSSLADEVVWYGSATDPLLALLPEQRYRASIVDVWMLRILDVVRALGLRGYSPPIATTLEIEVFDEVIRANAGRFVVEIASGRAEVRPGGSGLLRLDVRGLAALYAGYLTPSELVLMGLAEGEAGELDRAAAVFAGPPPAMRDFF